MDASSIVSLSIRTLRALECIEWLIVRADMSKCETMMPSHQSLLRSNSLLSFSSYLDFYLVSPTWVLAALYSSEEL